MNEDTISQYSEHQARRAAKRVGLKARKSRARAPSTTMSGFQIIDPKQTWVRPNGIVAGEKFDFTADDVVEFCAEYGSGEHKRQIGDQNESDMP